MLLVLTSALKRCSCDSARRVTTAFALSRVGQGFCFPTTYQPPCSICNPKYTNSPHYICPVRPPHLHHQVPASAPLPFLLPNPTRPPGWVLYAVQRLISHYPTCRGPHSMSQKYYILVLTALLWCFDTTRNRGSLADARALRSLPSAPHHPHHLSLNPSRWHFTFPAHHRL